MVKPPPETLHEAESSQHRHVTKAAGVVGSATLLSRILGYVRDMVIASLFGAGFASDAFLAAFRIPNMMRRLFGEGSLSIAFVPVYTDYLSQAGRSEADSLANSAFRSLAALLVVVSVIGIASAPAIVRVLAYGFSANPEKFALCVKLTRIMIPYIFFISLVALCMGILNVLGHFAAPALAPVGLNMSMIIAVVGASFWVTARSSQVVWLAVGVLIGGALQLGLQLPFLIRYKVFFWRPAPIWHPGLKRVLLLMGPVLFGAAVYQINSLVITLLASMLPQGSISYLYYADRLVQFPLGIFGIAAATAVLPTLARQASAQDHTAFQRTFGYAMRSVFFITLPCMAGLIVLREPIVALLFQRGAFDAQTTRLTASALLYYSMGLWAFSAVRIVLTAFYALKDTRTPVRMAVLSIAANIALGIVLMGPMQHSGLALALSSASVLNLGLLTWALRRKLGALGWGHIVASITKSLGCACCMGLVVWGLARWILPLQQGLRWVHLLIGLIVCILAGIAVFGGLAYFFKLPELQDVLQMVARRKHQA